MSVRSLVFSAVLLLNSLCVFSQVSVDKFSGAARVTIPLYTVSAGGVSLPIALSYYSNGVRPTDIEGSAGIGWNVIAGGAITRQVRGLPDDIMVDNASAGRLGWISNPNGTTINGMTISNSSNPPVYTNVQTDVNFITSHFGNLSDTEPDIFNVNAPGLSLQFVFDKDRIIRTIPYQDVQITYAYSGSGNGAITSFMVTNDMGVTYVFAAAESTIRKSTASTSPAWFKTDHDQYINGITYNSAWKLTQIHDRLNNSININYTTGTVMPSSSSVDVYLNGSSTKTNLDNVWQKTTPQLISNITYQDNNSSLATAFSFSYTNNYHTNASMILEITGFGRDFQFTYTPNKTTGYSRYFLTEVTDPDCNTPVNYTFSYNNLSSLPDSTTTQQDYWGYTNGNIYGSLKPLILINPSSSSYDRYRNIQDDGFTPSAYQYRINGNPRWTSSSYITIAALSQISYATGGYTTISYEPNDYYDGTGLQVDPGGGIRVKQLAAYDNINASPSVTTYFYNDPTTGQSSGKVQSLPMFAFTQAYTSSEADSIKWRKSTVVSWGDLSQDDHSVMYNYVKESRSGAGSTLYQFSVPVTNWDSSTPSGAPTWSPTMTYSGAPTNIAIGYLNNITRSYPFPPNTNYDFERGLPLSVISYDETGNKVSESTYTYNTPQTPVTISAFKYDANTIAEESYAKYYIYTTAGPLTTRVVNKLYSMTSPTSYRQTTDTFAYNGVLHKQLTQQTTANSDGTVYNKYIKYVKDYVITTSGDTMTRALLKLQAANVNSPVEEYSQVTPVGQSAITVSAGLVNYGLFKPGTDTLTLPSKRWKIAAPNGTTFTPSSINTASPNTFVYDNTHYTKVENDLAYDNSGYLLTSDNAFRHISTVLTDHNSFQPAAVIDNARYDEIAFSDYDSILPFANFGTSITLTTTSRSGKYANSMVAGQSMGKTVNRNLLASNYIISAWIRCSGTAGTISATITGGSNSGTNSVPYALTISNPSLYPTGWQYVEFKVPITSITTSTMSIVVSCSTAVIIDDVWAYPEIATVSSISYDPVAFFKTAVTNTNGVASYFSYDKFGRLLYAFDQDKNIVQRKIYASSANETNFNAPAITGSATAGNHISNTWGMVAPTYNSCVIASGVTYTWDFGDGTAKYTTASTSGVSHTYMSNGTFTISLAVSSPGYGSKASTFNVTVTSPTQTAVSYTNGTTGSSISSVVFKKHSTGVTMYTFTTTQLTAGQNITPDIYDVVITPTGPHYSASLHTGYGCVGFGGTPGADFCFAYTGSAFTATNVDLTYTPAVNFAMYTASACP